MRQPTGDRYAPWFRRNQRPGMPGRKLWHKRLAAASFRRESELPFEYRGRARYVVKIVDDEIPPEVVEMEFEALEYAISAGFPLQLPRIIHNKYKKHETGIKIHINSSNMLLLMSFVDGDQLELMSDISDILLINVGISLAQYNLAMQGFDHPAAHRNHRWNLVEAGQHRDKISLVRGDRVTGLVDFGDSCFNPVVCDLDRGFRITAQDRSGQSELVWQ